jgi:hypothetical protein
MAGGWPVHRNLPGISFLLSSHARHCTPSASLALLDQASLHALTGLATARKHSESWKETVFRPFQTHGLRLGKSPGAMRNARYLSVLCAALLYYCNMMYCGLLQTRFTLLPTAQGIYDEYESLVASARVPCARQIAQSLIWI